MPFPCHAVPLRVKNLPFLFVLHSAAVTDSHLPCHAPTMTLFSRPQHNTAVGRLPCCPKHGMGMGMAWAWYGKCESDAAALCKSNRKGKFLTLSGTAWARHAMCESEHAVSSITNADEHTSAASSQLN